MPKTIENSQRPSPSPGVPHRLSTSAPSIIGMGTGSILQDNTDSTLFPHENNPSEKGIKATATKKTKYES